MKKLTVFIAVFLTLLAVSACCQASGENLLKNADFSEIGSDGLPEGWYTDAYILEPGYTVFGKYEGDMDHPAAVSIRNIGENDARFAQTVEVEPDSLYCLSGFIRAENVKGGHGANFSVEGVYAFSDKCYDTEGEWEYIEYYGETGPEQDEITVFARLGGYSGESTGSAAFADLSLKKADSFPDDGIFDRWYRADLYEDDDDEYDDEYEEEPETPVSRRYLMLIVVLAYTAAALYVICRAYRKPEMPCAGNGRIYFLATAALLLFSLAFRLILSWFVKGYMVDVNCFLSWGHTMASVGPAGFYEATSFCDYPPLYTYVLALNSIVSRMLGGTEQIQRIVFRLIPSLCDVAGSWMLYRILIREKTLNRRSCLLFLAFTLFNPAMILNSAAWGQMDSVLCLLLACVALYAVKGKWTATLPVYVIAVLVKPQALMLGPLGLAYIVITWITEPSSRKRILAGTGISILVLAAGVIPFSIRQEWDWLIQLYARTLGSYRYATVNTANLYYILGGNWSAVDRASHVLAPVIMSVLSAGYGVWWLLRARGQEKHWIESAVSFAFSAVFIVLACLGLSWAWTGAFAMAFAFVIVLSPAVRSRNIRLLPWLGGLLFILLYVFGVKMHERYIFPALLLLASAWILCRDRRILYVTLLFSFTLFMNEYIVLDNSIRLGSELGHLNRDTVWFADLLSILNVAGSVYAVWLGTDLFLPGKQRPVSYIKQRSPLDWKSDRKLHWKRKDTVLLSLVTAVYAVITLLTLGSAKAPQTVWISSSPEEQIVFDLGESMDDVEILYFAQVSRNDFSISASEDGQKWDEETWAQMDQGQCWKWKYVTESYETANGSRTYYNDENNIVRFSGRYFRLTAQQFSLKLNEILFRSRDGRVLPVRISARTGAETESELYSDPEALIDEQDSMENLPAIPQTEETANGKIQPSWWNSTYFDEIYHARTGYEFLHASVPYETSHPPLGKVLMSAGIALFGMTPFGWRFAGALAGILMLPGMYLIAKQLTKKTRIAVLACMLMALDCMHLTQTQIATIDSFPVLFIIFAYFFMLRFIQTDYLSEKNHVCLFSLGLSGLFMGLSIASKWIGIYAGAGLAVLFFWHCIRMIRIRNSAEKLSAQENIPEQDRKKLTEMTVSGGTKDALKRTAVICAWCVLFFVIIPAAIYLLSFIPYMAYNKQIHSAADYLAAVWRCQIGMFNYHNTPGLGMDHPFYSPWWEWPVMGKPMYYASKLYLPADYPVHHSIFAFGNPAVWFGGLVALCFCVSFTVIRRRFRIQGSELHWHLSPATFDVRYMFVLVGLLAQYLPWVPVPRGTYIYHYFASLPFLMASICLCFDFRTVKRWQNILSICLVSAVIVVAAVFFVLLFPYASGINVPDAWLEIGKHLARIWY
ncbi:MAG: phospholipid carrier-dependent glycosyltransferase [Clostridiales bacterium]|nr:phospholipid carrier-dependent glycosyltransferase [Clostridiales bacterium]